MKLKLFINKNTNTVLYAEAGKDSVDFLLHTFLKPLGLAMKEEFNGFITGGLANLYSSIADDLSDDYLESQSAFLNPNLLKTLYTCRKCKTNRARVPVCDVYGAVCRFCKGLFYDEVEYHVPPGDDSAQISKGYVNWLMTYMITDDLVVKPLSTSLNMELFSNLGIKDITCVQAHEVTLDSDKGKELIKASLTSKTVLTDTFLPLKMEN